MPEITTWDEAATLLAKNLWDHSEIIRECRWKELDPDKRLWLVAEASWILKTIDAHIISLSHLRGSVAGILGEK